MGRPNEDREQFVDRVNEIFKNLLTDQTDDPNGAGVQLAPGDGFILYDIMAAAGLAHPRPK